MAIVEEEIDESVYWLELLSDGSNGIDPRRLGSVVKEAQELLAITVSSIKTARKNRHPS